jgi:peptidoglycan biosynthesis protein MviN/MurJ (putative lipid II flippase)
MPDADTLATVASIIAGFGAAMLAFRIEREAEGQEEGESPWIPWADALLLSAIFASLLLVVLPIVSFPKPHGLAATVPRAACSAACILASGYIVSILAHYRLLFGRKRRGERQNPEPAERWLVIGTALLSAAVFLALLR